MSRFFQGALALAAFGLVSAAGVASAETFEDVAVSARRVQDPSRLLWAFADGCKLQGDFARRACEGVRAARQAALAGKTYVTTTTGAVQVGKFDKGAVPVAVKGCIQCTPVKVDGAPWFVVTKGAATGDADGMTGPELGQTKQQVADEAEGKRWASEDASRLSTEVVYKLTGEKVAGKGAEALAVEVLAWRLIDRCSGDVLLSTPESAANAPASKGADCAGVAVAPDKGKTNDQPVDDGVPVEISRWDIQRTMNALKPQTNECYKKYQIPGNAQASVEIAPDGSVRSVSLTGDFQGTPTGACLIKVVQGAKFPPFKRGPIKISYPFILR